MYTNFRIQNFRGFKDLELKDLARVNLIAGKNNVGKTALLETIGIYSGRYDTLINRVQSSLGYKQFLPLNVQIHEWNTLFYDFNTKNEIRIIGKSEFDKNPDLNGYVTIKKVSPSEVNLQELHIKGMDVFRPRFDADILEIFWSVTETKSYLLRSNGQLENFNISGARIPTMILLADAHITSSDASQIYSDLKKERQTFLLVDMLHIIEPRLNDVELLADGLYGDVSGISNLIPLTAMGDAVGNLTNIVLALASVKGGILIVDELENGLHYSVQTDVWKAIAKAAEQFNVQIFATTHSHEMIQAAYEAFKETPEDDFRFHRLFRSQKSGDIDAVTYDQNNIEGALEMKLEVR